MKIFFKIKIILFLSLFEMENNKNDGASSSSAQQKMTGLLF
jgi:hypothetical protein